MSDFIYQPMQDKAIEEDNGSAYYCVIGSQDFIDEESFPRVNKEDDNRVLAKRIVRDDGSSRFSIKLTNSGKMQNPLSMYGIEKTNNFLDRVCRSDKKFKEVNQKVFNMYINFLKTKNIAWLNNAEREAE